MLYRAIFTRMALLNIG